MKRRLRSLVIAVLGLVACVVVVLITLSLTGLEPKERRPGLWLKGEPVATPVTDWSFTDSYQTILLETRTWYHVPHSVTVTCVASGGKLYLTSVYRPGMQFPRDRAWNRNVARDPHVRLKIGDRVFDETLVVVSDPAERSAVLRSKAAKYPKQRVSPTSTVYLFRVEPA